MAEHTEREYRFISKITALPSGKHKDKMFVIFSDADGNEVHHDWWPNAEFARSFAPVTDQPEGDRHAEP